MTVLEWRSWPPCARPVFVVTRSGHPVEPAELASSWKQAEKRRGENNEICAFDDGLTPADKLDLAKLGIPVIPLPFSDYGDHESHDVGSEPSQEPSSTRKSEPKKQAKQNDKSPVRARIYNLALASGIELFRTPEGSAFGVVTEGGHARPMHVSTRGTGVRSWLSRRYQDAEGEPPPRNAMAEAVQALADRALSPDSPVRPVHSRIAHVDGAVLVDLGDDSHRVARVTADGWKIVPASDDVLFQRHSRFGALPTPVHCAGSPMTSLSEVLGGVLDPDDLILATAWLFGVLSSGPYPILMVTAPQGSGKTSLARILKRLVDPVAGSGVVPPVRNPRDLVALVTAQLVACLDNLSAVTPEMSDVLACVATGGDFSERAYYTNFDLAVTSVKRPVLLTSILEIVTRGDLADRCLAVSPRSPRVRLSEAELAAQVEMAAPTILGGLLDAVAVALRELPSVQTPQTRMADFARWVLAGAPILGFNGEAFMDAYQQSREGLAGGVLEADPVASALTNLAEVGPWEGSLSNLCDRLAGIAGDDSKGKAWPRGPQVMAGALKRLAPLLEEHAGVEVEHHRGRNRRFWTVTRLSDAAQTGDASGGDGRHAGVTDPPCPSRKCDAVTPVTASPSVCILPTQPPNHHESTLGEEESGEGKVRGKRASQASRLVSESNSAAPCGDSPADLEGDALPAVEYLDGKVII